MRRKTLRLVFYVLIFNLFSSSTYAQSRIIFEDLLKNSTKGKQEGGEFVEGKGWRATNPFDRIMINLPRAARDGSTFEIDVSNLDLQKQVDAPENFLFGLWEHSGEAGGDQNKPNRDCFYIYAGKKYKQFKIKFHTHGYGWYENTIEPIEKTDPNHTYRFKLEWKQRIVKLSLDGKTLVTWESPVVDPMDRFSYIQIGARPAVASQREALRGPIFSNIRISSTVPSDPLAPEDLVLTDLSNNRPVLTWLEPSAKSSSKLIKEYLVYRNGEQVATTATNSFKDKALEEGVYYYSVKARYPNGKASSSTERLRVEIINSQLRVHQTKTPIKIDGKLNEKTWDLSSRLSRRLSGESSDTVKFGTSWDDQYLYVGVVVRDAKLIKDSTTFTDDDAIEILIDGNNNGAAFAYVQRKFDEHDRQFAVRWNDPGLYVKRGTSEGEYLPSGEYEGVKHAMSKTSDGFSVELAIPWATLQLSPSKTNSIGFDIRQYDDDDGQGVDAIAGWLSGHVSALITSNYGDLVLTSPQARR
jgi:hypothetical protein